MRKNYFLIFAIFTTSFLFSQEVYVNFGNNFTKYIYKDASGNSDSSLQSGTGIFYEVGFLKPFLNKNLAYNLVLSWNEYNAIGNNSMSSYNWNTHYMGIQGGLLYAIYSKSNFSFLLKTHLNASTLIYGKQQIDRTYYDLLNQKEFSGIILEPSIGIQLKYHISSFGYVSTGYNFCKSFNVSNTSNEKLSFNSKQIQLGIHFLINDSASKL